MFWRIELKKWINMKKRTFWTMKRLHLFGFRIIPQMIIQTFSWHGRGFPLRLEQTNWLFNGKSIGIELKSQWLKWNPKDGNKNWENSKVGLFDSHLLYFIPIIGEPHQWIYSKTIKLIGNHCRIRFTFGHYYIWYDSLLVRFLLIVHKLFGYDLDFEIMIQA